MCLLDFTALPNNSLERTGDAGAEARDNGDAGSWKAL